eukprot:6199670-Pleurochrysis_carterae.AAC.1
MIIQVQSQVPLTDKHAAEASAARKSWRQKVAQATKSTLQRKARTLLRIEARTSREVTPGPV